MVPEVVETWDDVWLALVDVELVVVTEEVVDELEEAREVDETVDDETVVLVVVDVEEVVRVDDAVEEVRDVDDVKIDEVEVVVRVVVVVRGGDFPLLVRKVFGLFANQFDISALKMGLSQRKCVVNPDTPMKFAAGAPLPE